jgi:hypothetical protein
VDDKLVGVASATDGASRSLYSVPDAIHRAYHTVAAGVSNAVADAFSCPDGFCKPRPRPPQVGNNQTPQKPKPPGGNYEPPGTTPGSGPAPGTQPQIPGKPPFDLATITAFLDQWFEKHKAELKGQDGKDGAAGPPGEPGPQGEPGQPGTPGNTPTIDYGRIVQNVLEGMPRPEPGMSDAQVVALVNQIANQIFDARKTEIQAAEINYDEIARRVELPEIQAPTIDYDQVVAEVLKRLPPIYIGSKDATGNVVMPLEAVRLGDGFYVRVKPPALE